MKSCPVKKLNDGNTIPMLGYGVGTAHLKSDDNKKSDQTTVTCISDALTLGFTHLDNAEWYHNEPEMGEAIKESSIPRDRLFVATKVIDNIYDIPSAVDASLSKLGLEYVDLYMIHNPHFTEKKEELQKAWKDMEAVQRSGKAKSIGVSAFQIKHLEAILEVAEITPAINQFEFHPYLQREALREFGESKGIATAAFSPLVPLRHGAPGPLDSVVKKLAEKYGMSPEVILLRWTMQKDVVTITTSRQKERMEGYLKALDFVLSDEDVDEITRIGKQKHLRWNHFMHKYPDSDRE